MLRKILLVGAVAAASAFAPTLPSYGRSVAPVGPTMQRIGSARPAGGSAGAPRPGSMGTPQRAGSSGVPPRQGSMAPKPSGSQLINKPRAAPVKAAAKPAAKPAATFRQAPKPAAAVKTVQKAAPVRSVVPSGRFSVGNPWDIEGADWARDGGIFGKIGDVIWAREAEVKHGRVCMLAATGAIVQDLYHFPFMDKWYQGEKMWGLHDAAIKSGALWQVLFFIGLLELPFLLKLRDGTVDGTGDIGFDPLGLKNDPDAFARRQVTEVKNGRLAMIAISGMTHHYFLTGKGPIEFITQIPNFKSCTAAAVETGLCV